MLIRRFKRYLAERACGFMRRLQLWEADQRLRQLQSTGVLEIGRHTYGRPVVDVYRGSEARVIIGSFCSISRNVLFLQGGIHPTDWISTYPFRVEWGMEGAYADGSPCTRGDIVVGHDVWIGTEAVILSGVRIGSGSVVAARAVVTRDVPPYSIVAGVPARVVRMRFDEATVARLLETAWWTWDDERIREHVPLLCSAEIEAFLKAAESTHAEET